MALACGTINETYNSYVCDSSTPGVDTIYLSNINNVTGLTISSGNVITAMSVISGNCFYELRPYVETADASNITTLNETGNATSLHNLKFKLNGVSTDSVQLGYSIFRSSSVAIVKMSSGKYFFYGSVTASATNLGRGMTSKKYDVLNGVKSEDFNGVDLEIEAKLSRPAYEIDSTIVAALVTSA